MRTDTGTPALDVYGRSLVERGSFLMERTGGSIAGKHAAILGFPAQAAVEDTPWGPADNTIVRLQRASRLAMRVADETERELAALLSEKTEPGTDISTSLVSLEAALRDLIEKTDWSVLTTGATADTGTPDPNPPPKFGEATIPGLVTGEPGPEDPADMSLPKGLADASLTVGGDILPVPRPPPESSGGSPVKTGSDTGLIRVTNHPYRSEKELLDMLDKDFESYPTREEGWDGYSAEPLIPESLVDARTFLEQRPQGVKVPFSELDPDGLVGLYWEQGEVFASTVFEGDGRFYYCASFRDDSGKVIEPQADDCEVNAPWPAELLQVVRRLG